MADHLWLNLGCADNLLKDFVNVDRQFEPSIHGSFEILVTDLTEQWPWAPASVDFILACDIIEHLPDKIFTMNEAWRVLKPQGQMLIEVPTTAGPGAFQDPTHVSFWNERSFLYFTAFNIYRERFAKSYGIRAAFRVISQNIDQTDDGPKLTIRLEAVK